MRIQSIDLLKGISILSIMLLHFEDGWFPASINVWIGNFMISAFYVCSGWLTAVKPDCSRNDLFQKKWRTLGIPYCWFTIIILLFDLLLWTTGNMDGKLILRDAYKSLTLRGIGTLWFLPALFFGEIIFWYFRQKGAFFKIAVLVLTFLFLGGYNIWDARFGHQGDLFRLVDAPFRALSNMASAWYMIACGFYLQKWHAASMRQWPLWYNVPAALILLVWYTLVVENIVPSTISMLAPIIGPFALLLLCMTGEEWKGLRFLSYFGRNSLIVMVTHYSILQELCILANRYWFGQESLRGLNALLFFAAAVIVEVPCIWIINRKASFLLGK